jgi:hypothetical protein
MTPSKIKLFKYYYSTSGYETSLRYYTKNNGKEIEWFGGTISDYNNGGSSVRRIEPHGFSDNKYHGNEPLYVFTDEAVIDNFNNGIMNYFIQVITNCGRTKAKWENTFLKRLSVMPSNFKCGVIEKIFKELK